MDLDNEEPIEELLNIEEESMEITVDEIDMEYEDVNNQ